MSNIDSQLATSTITSGVPTSITALATVTIFTSSSPVSVDTALTPVGLSECVQRCVINVATGGPYGTCTAELEDMNCICSDERFQAATDGCIFNVCPSATSQALVFASQFCAGVMTPAWAASSATGLSNATIGESGLSTAAVAGIGIGIGSAFGGMTILAAATGALIFFKSRRSYSSRPSRWSTFLPRPFRAELPAYQVDAKEVPDNEVSPISPSSSLDKSDARSPIETVLSRDEQDELHRLRMQVRAMQLERQRVELDGGLGGLREMEG